MRQHLFWISVSLSALLFVGCLSAPPNLPPKVEVYGGHCDAVFPGSALESFRHPIDSGLTVKLGAPNHRVQDLILSPGESALLRARFTYGLTDKDLEDERVEVWLQRCPAWESLGIFLTDDEGFVTVDIPANLPKGDYLVRFVVLGDGTTADGIVAVWPRGVKVVLSDIDGTLTTSDFELFEDLLLGQDAEMFVDADTAMQTWAEKGYRIVYLTGRPQIISRYSRTWLAGHGLPPGPLKLTDQATEVIPTDSGVRVFKADFANELKARVGVEFVAAYGNATTDIGAYADAGIPKESTFIIGAHAGEEGTAPLTSYTDHLPFLSKVPQAVQP